MAKIWWNSCIWQLGLRTLSHREIWFHNLLLEFMHISFSTFQTSVCWFSLQVHLNPSNFIFTSKTINWFMRPCSRNSTKPTAWRGTAQGHCRFFLKTYSEASNIRNYRTFQVAIFSYNFSSKTILLNP